MVSDDRPRTKEWPVETLLNLDLVNNTLDLGLEVSRSRRVKID